MKKYTFWDDGYYDGCGCDCCEDTYMECYNSVDTDCNMGTAHSIEDCYVQALLSAADKDYESAYYKQMLCYEELDGLKELVEELGIQVEVIS